MIAKGDTDWEVSPFAPTIAKCANVDSEQYEKTVKQTLTMRKIIFVGSVMVWLATIVLLVPCTGISCAFGLLAMNIKRLPSELSVLNSDLVVIFSFFISAFIMLIASYGVIVAATDHIGMLLRIFVIDLVILAIAFGFWITGIDFLRPFVH